VIPARPAAHAGRLGLLLAPALAGCAVFSAPIPNPDRLPADALALEYLLDGGCFPYLLGETSEQAAMAGLRLHHVGPGPSLTPPGPPMWLGSYPGRPNVVVGRASCSVHVHGRDTAAYRRAVEHVARRRFGAAVDQDSPSRYKALLPGQISACHQGLHYTYYQEPRGTTFSVEINRIPACATDPMLSLG
jgi:hypothetical protein